MNDHEKFERLAALATAGSLSSGEWAELKAHLAICEPCHEAFLQYRWLAEEELPILAAAHAQEQPAWDDRLAKSRLLARVQAADLRVSEAEGQPLAAGLSRTVMWTHARHVLLRAAIAACVVAAMGIAVHQTIRTRSEPRQVANGAAVQVRELLTQKKSLDSLLETQTAKLAGLQAEGLQREHDLGSLRLQLRAAAERSNGLIAEKKKSQADLQTAAQQREALTAALHEAEQASVRLQADLASLRNERDNALLQTASLASRIEELSTTNREQERRLKDTGQYLASDRDIRELMGARKLYIADVFDVDSGSRTKKPFGRVFYTQGKSLIFYAFDLDASPGLKNASAFQVWGKRETAEGQQARALNLGILYLDSESNRRWVMRFDDPKELAEIDAVFVTVEPHGGSQKPTGKPFLYALLRKEVNHP
jgi:hypothetical protein